MQTAAASPTGATNFLIIGSDTRSFVKSEGDKEAFTNSDTTADGPARSDTMMVLHADGDQSYAVSFPRDLWVNVPGHGKEKINAAFNDGPQKVIDTLKADFDLDIQHYLEVNFKTFEDIVNAVGSVPVYFPYPARDQLSGLGPTWVGGCYQLDGPNALAVRALAVPRVQDQRGLAEREPPRRHRPHPAPAGLHQEARPHRGRSTRSTTRLLARDLADQMIPNLTVDHGFDRAAFNQLVEAFIGLSGETGGPTFETLPWEMGNASRLVPAGEAARGRGDARDPARVRRRSRRRPPRRPARPGTGGSGTTSAPAGCVRPTCG